MINRYIYGAGGHGKVVLDAMQLATISCLGFIDDKEIATCSGLSVTDFSSLTLDQSMFFHLAVGNCEIREKLANSLPNLNYFNVIHSSAALAKTSIIGLGSFCAAQAVIGPDAQVGNHCIVNHGAVVDHDCVVGSFSHIAPLASLGGGVSVGKGVLVGAGAIVLPGLVIGDYAVIGAGSVITKNVPAEATLVGNPAKPLK